MAKQYHINPETGRPNQCTATVRGCKYAVDGELPEHYSSKDEARAAYETSMNASQGMVNTLKKPAKSDPNAAGKIIEETEKTRAIKVQGFPNFNPASDSPEDFDIVAATVNERFLDANARRNRADERIQSLVNPKRFNKLTNRREYTKDRSKALAEFRQMENPSPFEKRMIQDWETAEAESRKQIILKTQIDQVYRERGMWNRAFLVPDGHLHKSTDCSTCNKGETPTKFQFMTEYSGKDEKQIVGDAGYRACTTCYPSAPIGDERSLPSKMLTDSEKERAIEQAKRKEELAKKKADVANKAPTVEGKPLSIKEGRYQKQLKTERAAAQWYTTALADGPPRSAEYADELKQNRYKILYNLALKNDVPMSELKEELEKKAVEKSKRDYKASEKHFAQLGGDITMLPYEEPKPDEYEVPSELMNKSPRDWENANKYIPE